MSFRDDHAVGKSFDRAVEVAPVDRLRQEGARCHTAPNERPEQVGRTEQAIPLGG